MRARVVGFVSMILGAMLVLVVTASGQTSPSAATPAATPKSVAANTKPPRTPWGAPDLQGTWDYRSITPLERPKQFGDREFLTDAEVKEMEERAAKRLDEAPEEDDASRSTTIHAPYWTDPGRKVSGTHRTSLIIDPPTGRIPALTPEAEKRAAARRPSGPARPGGKADSWLDRSALERCITWGLPTAILPGLYNNNIQIVQTPTHVAIVHEMVHDTRIIPLDGTPQLASNIRQWMGNSRGHWEGDTLVVETTNFSDKVSYRGATPSMKLVERFTRIDQNTIDFKVTVEDPNTWTKPWTAALQMRPSEGELYEYACHESNYGLRNILEVARDEEKAAASTVK